MSVAPLRKTADKSVIVDGRRGPRIEPELEPSWLRVSSGETRRGAEGPGGN